MSKKKITMPYSEYLKDLAQAKAGGITDSAYWKEKLNNAYDCFSSSYPNREEYYRHVKNLYDFIQVLNKGNK